MHFCHILMDKVVIGLAQIQRNRGKRPHLSMGGRERGCNKEFAAFSYCLEKSFNFFGSFMVL